MILWVLKYRNLMWMWKRGGGLISLHQLWADAGDSGEDQLSSSCLTLLESDHMVLMMVGMLVVMLDVMVMLAVNSVVVVLLKKAMLVIGVILLVVKIWVPLLVLKIVKTLLAVKIVMTLLVVNMLMTLLVVKIVMILLVVKIVMTLLGVKMLMTLLVPLCQLWWHCLWWLSTSRPHHWEGSPAQTCCSLDRSLKLYQNGMFFLRFHPLQVFYPPQLSWLYNLQVFYPPQLS